MSLHLSNYLFAIVLAAGLVLAVGSSALGWLRARGCRQYIREEGPDRHQGKAGTPTLGGILFIPAALLAGLGLPLIIGKLRLPLLMVGGLTLVFMLIGLADDLMMLKRKGNLGFKARHKLLLQFVVAGLFLYGLYQINELPGMIRLPFKPELWLPPNWLYVGFATLLIVGASNATNLTDGLDGLLAGLAAMAAMALAIFSYWLGKAEVALFSCALAGACLGFLFYNRHPARVFMGDTGSLALGAAFSGIAILLGAELLFFFIGAIFFIEALSVMLQVISFKSTGRRIFKMSPLHHHFELSGWKETRVVKVFWAASAVITVATLLGTHFGWSIG